MTDPSEQKPRKWGCLQWLLLSAAVIGLILLIFGLLVWQTISWIQNAPEPAAASYPHVQLSEGERDDLQRVVGKLANPKSAGETVDESVTATVLNGVLETLLEDARDREHKKDTPLFIRTTISDGVVSFKAVLIPTGDMGKNAKPGEVVTAEGNLSIEIVDHEVTKLAVSDFSLHGRPAPFIARRFINLALNAIRDASHQKKDSADNDLAAIKLLKVEGDRVHAILDSKIMAEQQRLKKEREEKNHEEPAKKKPDEPREL